MYSSCVLGLYPSAIWMNTHYLYIKKKKSKKCCLHKIYIIDHIGSPMSSIWCWVDLGDLFSLELLLYHSIYGGEAIPQHHYTFFFLSFKHNLGWLDYNFNHCAIGTLRFLKELSLANLNLKYLQDIMILPIGASRFEEAVQMGSETYHHLKVIVFNLIV